MDCYPDVRQNNAAFSHVFVSPIAQFIYANFRGANVTVTLPIGSTISGEVVGRISNIVALKSGSTINFVNANYIVSFV